MASDGKIEEDARMISNTNSSPNSIHAGKKRAGHLVVTLIIGSILWSEPLISRAADRNPPAPKTTTDELSKRARAAFAQGKTEEAFALAKRAIEVEPKNPQGYYARGKLHEITRQHEKAIADFTEVLKLTPRSPQVLNLRGSEQFKLGNIKESIADFDKAIEIEPALAPQHWQRGISYYYAGRFEDGRKQFELHQTVNSSDVENAVWHFLCVARSAGLEPARAALIPINADRRVPMMQVFALFAGTGTAEGVLAAAKTGEPSPEELKQRLFYAHLYLGLYHEATGNPKLSEEHMSKASGEFAQDHYMGDVAKVHAKLRKIEPATIAK
jgi:lipoprotein NlpI